MSNYHRRTPLRDKLRIKDRNHESRRLARFDTMPDVSRRNEGCNGEGRVRREKEKEKERKRDEGEGVKDGERGENTTDTSTRRERRERRSEERGFTAAESSEAGIST